MVGGVLVLNSLFSYLITSTPFWTYAPLASLPHLFTKPLVLTESELARYSGADDADPIYLGINGNVYDVTKKRRLYGPGGSYSFFAGADCARAFVTGCFKTDCTHDLRGIPQDRLAQLHGWESFFKKEYRWVGTVVHDEPTGDPPPLCTP